MASGACIPQLLRVHFANIGHPDARLSPLTLNFFRETEEGELEPVDSVIWAENGVGKSSIRTLLFSLLHPSIHDVMKASGGPLDNRKYELFFGPKDHSFVLTEWALPDSDQPNLTGFPDEPNRLILGYVAHWPTGTRTSLGDLERHYFLFKPRGKVTFERLPVRGLARGGEPLGSARQFLDWFREQSKYVEGRHTTVHKEWLEMLEDAGLDPVIFTYQLRMNSGQGGILGLFKNRINSATDFVHFFLETVLHPDVASDVVEVLNEKRRHVERQPQWEAECEFVDEAIPKLRALQQIKATFENAQKDYFADLGKAGEWVAGLELAHTRLASSGRKLALEIEACQGEVSEVNESFLSEQMTRDWLRQKECELAQVEAEADLGSKKEAHDAALDVLRLLRAASEYVEWQAKLDECRALEQALASRKGSYGDVEEQLNRAGACLVAKLGEEIEAVQQHLEQARTNFGDLRNKLAKEMTAFNTGKIEMGRVREEIRGIQAVSQKREKAMQRLAHTSALLEGEEITDAFSRWRGVKTEANAQIEKGQSRLEQLERESEALKAKSRQTTVDRTRVQGELEALNEKRGQDEARRNDLLNDSDLRLMFDMDEVDLGEEGLLGRVRERINQLQHEAFRLNNALADERETLTAIEQTDSRLYPPPTAVAQLMRTLREEFQIPVFLGTEALDTKFPDDPEAAEALLVQDPSRFLGLMVHSKDALEKIRKLRDSIPRPAFPVQVSLVDGAMSPEPPDAMVLAPGHRAAFNRNAAQAMIDPLRRDISDKSLRLSECDETSKRLAGVAAKLSAFLADYPEGDLRELLAKIGEYTTRFDNLRETQTRLDDRLVEVEAELAEWRAEEVAALNRIRMADTAMSRIQDFEEDHVTPLQSPGPSLAEKRERLHQLEDESLVLEASLEETQRALSERQEAIFNHKNQLAQLEQEMRRVAYAGSKPKKAVDLTLVEARDTYKLHLDRYLQVSEKDETLRARLEEKRAMAEHGESRFRRELADGDEAVIEDMLAQGSLADRMTEASHAEALTAKAVGAAEAMLANAHEAGRQLQPLADDYKPSAKDKKIKDLKTVRQRLVEQKDLLQKLEGDIESAKAKLAALKERERSWNEQQKFLQLKCEELKTHISDFTPGEPCDIPEDTVALNAQLREFWDQFRQHRRLHSKSKLDLETQCDKLKDLAFDERFKSFPNDKRDILKTRDAVVNLTEDIIKEFTIFRDVIRTSLRMSEESVDAIVTRLDAGVTDAFYLLNQSKQSSRLPESMEGWAGKSFLKIECKSQVGEGFSSRRPIYERVVRDLLRSGKPFRGLDIIKRALDALVGEKGYKVVIMKPGYALKTQYHPITDVKGWSDGEKITSVILLYCTMVQLRALSSGKISKQLAMRQSSNGMLFLDNPFGEANSLTFVKMQLLMARALNIQLVYTASGSHKHLMARFPRVIRLSQESGSKTQKTYVKATDVGADLRNTVSATHVQAAHFGQRAS